MSRVSPFLFIAAFFSSSSCPAPPELSEPSQVTVETDGTVHATSVTVPYSSLASRESRRNYLDIMHSASDLRNLSDADIATVRKELDYRLMRPGVERLRAAFAVDITPRMINGVQTDLVQPAGGVAERNKRRVLISLHGGGFAVGAGLGGQMGSIPIASLGAIKVISVDYREGPEHRFPAASEDVAAVYRELLKRYKPESIGIYGCSAGGVLAAESVAWFQAHGLPIPGAIGMFGDGALFPLAGDSGYFGSLLSGMPPRTENAKNWPYFDVPGLDVKDPLVSPAYSLSVLARFPPSLLISGTRDSELSTVVYTHAQLIKAKVAADLHVWEGAFHCSFAQPVVDPKVPETREAWDVIVKFFDSKLAK